MCGTKYIRTAFVTVSEKSEFKIGYYDTNVLRFNFSDSDALKKLDKKYADFTNGQKSECRADILCSCQHRIHQ